LVFERDPSIVPWDNFIELREILLKEFDIFVINKFDTCRINRAWFHFASGSHKKKERKRKGRTKGRGQKIVD
jgi:putative protein kinase ArgK-like GTPase of G3E family